MGEKTSITVSRQQKVRAHNRIWHSLSFLPPLAGNRGKEERRREEGGEEEGWEDS